MVEGRGNVKQILRQLRPLVSHPIQFSSPAVAKLLTSGSGSRKTKDY